MALLAARAAEVQRVRPRDHVAHARERLGETPGHQHRLGRRHHAVEGLGVVLEKVSAPRRARRVGRSLHPRREVVALDDVAPRQRSTDRRSRAITKLATSFVASAFQNAVSPRSLDSNVRSRATRVAWRRVTDTFERIPGQSSLASWLEHLHVAQGCAPRRRRSRPRRSSRSSRPRRRSSAAAPARRGRTSCPPGWAPRPAANCAGRS